MENIAYVGKIINIDSIEGADFIVSTTVVCGKGGKWMGTVKKDQFKVDDLVEVYLQDALLPETPEFEFMKNYKYKVSMRRFKGVPSEVLIMPLSIESVNIGDDISAVKNIAKYSKPISARLSGIALSQFPTHLIPKTDEPNFQRVPEMLDALRGQRYYATVKADGSSGTIYRLDDHFGCCSRNLELKESKDNALWRLAYKYDLQKTLPNKIAIQFETVGPSIQKNRLQLPEIDLECFNVWDIENRKYLNAIDMLDLCEKLGIPNVQILLWNETFDFETEEDLRKLAEGLYENTKYQREGIVIRPMIETMVNGERLSFKVINLLYKD